jgi:hypothetical protein
MTEEEEHDLLEEVQRVAAIRYLCVLGAVLAVLLVLAIWLTVRY